MAYLNIFSILGIRNLVSFFRNGFYRLKGYQNLLKYSILPFVEFVKYFELKKRINFFIQEGTTQTNL